MEEDGRKGPGRERPANDNHPPHGQDAGSEADVGERLETVVLTIARLIGGRMARANFEKALRAANDNAPPACHGAKPETEDKD